HDLYYKVINPKASAHRRLVISKSQLLVVAVVAAWVASMRPDNILFMVGLAFSIGASAFFPALVLGIFWKRANRPGAVTGMVAWRRAGHLLFMVRLAVSLGASAFLPALVLGIFWKRANRPGAVTGMLAGLAVTIFYVVRTHPFFGGSMTNAWFDINPISAGVFGVPLVFVTIVVISLLTRPPPQEIQDLVDYVRYPDVPGQERPHL